jgi:hypothetical protein
MTARQVQKYRLVPFERLEMPGKWEHLGSTSGARSKLSTYLQLLAEYLRLPNLQTHIFLRCEISQRKNFVNEYS